MPSVTSRRRFALKSAAAVACLFVGGCYNAERLVERVRDDAIRTRMEEVALGSFRVTLPRHDNTGEMTEIDIRIFGRSQRYKINEIESDLEAKGPQIEDRTLRTLRETSHEELAEPELTTLRKRLLAAMNEELTDAPLDSIGFYDVRFMRH
ncbi:MAG: flagellar basal body-associated FliL family protein [Planctomycetota bacterium]